MRCAGQLKATALLFFEAFQFWRLERAGDSGEAKRDVTGVARGKELNLDEQRGPQPWPSQVFGCDKNAITFLPVPHRCCRRYHPQELKRCATSPEPEVNVDDIHASGRDLIE
jgi:hypothetical protein